MPGIWKDFYEPQFIKVKKYILYRSQIIDHRL